MKVEKIDDAHVYDSSHPRRSSHADLEAEIAAVIVARIVAGDLHSSYKSLTGKVPSIWVEAYVATGIWRIAAWETNLVAVARFNADEALSEEGALRAALEAWRRGECAL